MLLIPVRGYIQKLSTRVVAEPRFQTTWKSRGGTASLVRYGHKKLWSGGSGVAEIRRHKKLWSGGSGVAEIRRHKSFGAAVLKLRKTLSLDRGRAEKFGKRSLSIAAR